MCWGEEDEQDFGENQKQHKEGAGAVFPGLSPWYDIHTVKFLKIKILKLKAFLHYYRSEELLKISSATWSRLMGKCRENLDKNRHRLEI